MRLLVRALVVVACCVAGVGGLVYWLTLPEQQGRAVPAAHETADRSRPGPARSATGEAASPDRQEYPDPNAPGTSARVFTDPVRFDGSVLNTAVSFTPPIRDPSSLLELREAVRARGRRGITELRELHDRLKLDSPPTPAQAKQAMQVRWSIAFLYLYDGKLFEANAWLDRALELAQSPDVPSDVRVHLHALKGIVALRRGEVENCLECLGPSSCILPIAPEAVHKNQTGSREAVRQFMAALDDAPGDLRLRWLLNIAHMTLGEYPDKVPARYVVPIDQFRSKVDIGRFDNVAARVGLTSRGPTLGGGSIFDDFTGDGLPDIFTTSVDVDMGASLFVNKGDGTFDDRSIAAGLAPQIYALNVARADFDNDGNPDVVLFRGGWEKPIRLSLLRNTGSGVFEDVTVPSGLAEPIATESGAWGDYDNDGLVDLFVCGEYQPPPLDIAGGTEAPPTDPRNYCRLYHNRGDGTFENVAEHAGVRNGLCAKGCAWGDYDGDGWLDLFVSNMFGPSRLYRNKGDGTFRDVALESGIDGSPDSFSCFFWDFDNDGRLDIFLCDYKATMSQLVGSYLGMPMKEADHPRLYRNLGDSKFRDVSEEVGLGRPLPAMSMNFGDVDNDGFLDLYMGSGWMTYSSLVPGVMLKNAGGRKFEDVTISSGTGHLQKGHGVSFADWNCDGQLDLFLVLGGGFPGDSGYCALFQNPGHKGHWLKVKLVGTKTNRSALGASIHATVKGADGQTRSIHRVVGNNASFGGNSLVESLGLSDATSVSELSVSWPTSHTTQTFRDIAADQAIEITEGTEAFKTLTLPPLPPAPRAE